jgi:hypothetical protein
MEPLGKGVRGLVGGRDRLGVTPSKQGAKTLLPEVLVVGQDVREATSPLTFVETRA